MAVLERCVETWKLYRLFWVLLPALEVALDTNLMTFCIMYSV